MTRIILAALLLLTSVTPAASWSEDGHRIVCAIAWKELSAEARTAIERLLEDDPAASFPEACVWADAIRGNPAYDWARPHHYINVPKGAGGIDLARDCLPNPGCVISAIGIHRTTLSDPNAATADKTQALKFLAHFIGDIHQPLHVGRAEDRGGNAIRVRFLGEETSLHAVWDDGLIAHLEPDWQILADRLQAQILDAERITWRRSDVLDWAEESRQLAEMRVYPEPKAGWTLSQEYVTENGPEVAEQLKKAGVRLATTLEEVLRQQRP